MSYRELLDDILTNRPIDHQPMPVSMLVEYLSDARLTLTQCHEIITAYAGEGFININDGKVTLSTYRP